MINNPGLAETYPSPYPCPLGWYAGLGLSRVALLYDRGTATGFMTEDEEMTNSNIGFNAFVGDRISKYLGFQFGFAYPGKSDGTDNLTGKIVRTYTEMYNTYVEGFVYLPIVYGFELFIKAGPALQHFESIGGGNEAGGGSAVYKYTTFDLNYGAGLQYTYKNIGLRAAFNSNYRRMSSRHSELIGGQYGARDWVDLDVFYLFAPANKNQETADIDSQSLGWYIGTGVNHISELDETLKLRDGSPHAEQYLLKSKGFGYEALFGKRISNYLGGEIGFEHIGDYIGKDKNSGATVISYTQGNDGYIDAIFYIPINNHFDFFVKAGPSLKHFAQDYVIPINDSSDESVHHVYTFFDLNYGAGIQYMFNKVGVRFVYSSNYRIEDYTSRDSIGLDFIYRFGD